MAENKKIPAQTSRGTRTKLLGRLSGSLQTQKEMCRKAGKVYITADRKQPRRISRADRKNTYRKGNFKTKTALRKITEISLMREIHTVMKKKFLRKTGMFSQKTEWRQLLATMSRSCQTNKTLHG